MSIFFFAQEFFPLILLSFQLFITRVETLIVFDFVIFNVLLRSDGKLLTL